MPKRYKGYKGLADFETRVVDRAVQSEASRLYDGLYPSTAGPGIGQTARAQRITDELLAAGDPPSVQKAQQMRPHLSPDERKALNRRVVRAGGTAVFPEDGL